MRLYFTILVTIVVAVSANMREMKPLKELIDYLLNAEDLTDDQYKMITSKTSEKMLNREAVDSFKMNDRDSDRDELSKEDVMELSQWLDDEVTSKHMSVDTANYVRAILDLPPSQYATADETAWSGPVDKEYEGNGLANKLAWRDYDPLAAGSNLYNGIWGYATGSREYALHTSYKGLNIFDVTDAEDDNIFKVQTIGE